MFSIDFTTSDVSSILNSPNLSILPLLAYHKICNDHYRNEKWQPFEPWTCNIDYLNPTDNMNAKSFISESSFSKLMTSIIDLENSNLPIDYFTSVLPRAQYGDESAVSTEEERVILQYKCRRCINCGEVITKEDWFWIDGDTLCADRYENLLGEEIEICDICGCAHFSDNDRMIYIQEEEQLICDECAERHYFQCSNCGKWTKEILPMADGDYICNECFETGDYYICDDCGNVIDPDTDGIIIRSDSVHCEDCASEHADPNEEYIHEYGYSPCIMFNEGNELNSCPKKGERYFGLEIETIS